MSGRADSTSTPSSSRNSRTSPGNRCSSRCSLPPGNSHSPPMCNPGGRWAISTLPPESYSTPATTAIRRAVNALSAKLAVALLVLFAGTAWAGLVAAYLWLFAYERRLRLSRSRPALTHYGAGLCGGRRLGLPRDNRIRFRMPKLHLAGIAALAVDCLDVFLAAQLNA